ncbi:hypothetical protein [Bacillus mycoides]|uniref:hypothetical protein n=1 Tax=Bacillus mycoides TaxID=1405 RepID=UPI00155F9EA5|nr:hypothetical protein [Bacillus mycoides]
MKNAILSYDFTERIAHFFILGAFLFINLIAMWRFVTLTNKKRPDRETPGLIQYQTTILIFGLTLIAINLCAIVSR